MAKKKKPKPRPRIKTATPAEERFLAERDTKGSELITAGLMGLAQPVRRRRNPTLGV